MTAKRKRVGGGAFPSDPRILKKASTKRNLVRGLTALGSMWKRGLLPRDLENHWLVTWLAYENGNVRRLSDTIGLHRNTLILNFKEKVKKPSTFKLRTLWRKIQSKKAEKPFTDKLFEFYHKTINRPRFPMRENESLANLWLMGIHRKVVRAHFIIWSFRQGRKLEEICKRLGKHTRSIHRYRTYVTRPGSPAQKWLAPMKALKDEWFPPGLSWKKKTLKK